MTDRAAAPAESKGAGGCPVTPLSCPCSHSQLCPTGSLLLRDPQRANNLCARTPGVGPSGKRLVGVLHSFFLQGGDRTGHKVTMCSQGHIKRASVDTLPID